MHTREEVMKMLKLDKQLQFVDDNLLFLVLSGSHAYGLNRPESDMDYRGICMPPLENFLTLKNFEQKEDKKNDITIYSVVKFLQLARDVNPNIVELLFVDPDAIVYKHPVMDKILENKHLFLSKRAQYRFSGYAFAQLKRIRGHKVWLDNPLTKPDRKTMGLPHEPKMTKDKIRALASLGRKELEEFVSGDNIDYVFKEVEYFDLKKEYDRYKEWLDNRNPARAALEAKCGYDCYLEGTEFLTKDGWKEFKDVNDSDKLATINKQTNELQYQNYKEKYCGSFTGNMYELKGYRHECIVTPNHKMFIQKQERKSGKHSDWKLQQASLLPDTFNVLNHIVAKKTNYKQPELNIDDLNLFNYLKIMGLYISDGTMTFRKGNPKDVRVSQVKPIVNRILSVFKKKNYTSLSHYIYHREANGFRLTTCNEHVWIFNSKKLAEKIFHDCGHGSSSKRIPRWVFSLSKRMMTALLISMLRGDGTKRDSGIMVYYTINKDLANDVNELAILSGYQSWILGPYDGNYQVHIDLNPNKNTTFIRSANIKTKHFEKANVVCFTVPNETLVTRYNGYVSFHGNSKHAMHLIRLMRVAREIATTGTMHTKRPDRDFLMSIREGNFSYDTIVDMAEREEKELGPIYENSDLPNSVNVKKIDRLLLDVVKEFYNLDLEI